MAYYGNGFTILELYKLPTHIRNFYYSKLVEAKKKEAEQNKKHANPNTNASRPPKVKINR